jgi:TRAP-type C4-dicarboxylate transport system substrate-binding protein
MCEEYVETLCNMMAEESGGRLQFVFNPGGSLLGATETIDGVKDGAADMCWSCTSFFSGRFPIAEFINLSGNGIKGARYGTDVFQQMYDEIPELQDEFKDWKVIALHSCGYAPICTVGTKIETKDDLSGLQIRAAGTIPTQYINAIGANAISMPTTDVYEALEKHVIDGMANDYHNIDCFKLYEPIDYCFDYPVNHTSCFVLMNKELYESMDDELKAIIDKYANGYAGDMAGYWWDSCNWWVQDEMKENGVEIVTPSDDMVAYLSSEEILGPIHQWYVDYLNEAGLDGQAIYDKCMEIVAANAAAHEHDWDAAYTYTDWTETP